MSSWYGAYNCQLWKAAKRWCITGIANRNSMLRDSKDNEYPYFAYDAPKMLKKLLEEGLIELSQSKHVLSTIEKDPKYSS